MKITWWGWIIILVVAYWWLTKKGYLRQFGLKYDAASDPINPCSQKETCQQCYDCLMAPQQTMLAYEAEQTCRDWNCEGEFNFPD